MASGLRGHDVLILSEVFDDRARECLIGRLALDYPYSTSFVEPFAPWLDDGGLLVLSKWPIRREARRSIGADGPRMDCLASIGVVYAELETPSGHVHIFGCFAHAVGAAGSSYARREQFRALRAFVDEQGVPRSEPLLVAGDANVDMSSESEARLALLSAVGARFEPPHAGEAYTYDPETNRLARGQGRALRDYVLISSSHRQPASLGTAVMPLRTDRPWWKNVRDLSDHHGLWARLIYD